MVGTTGYDITVECSINLPAVNTVYDTPPTGRSVTVTGTASATKAWNTPDPPPPTSVAVGSVTVDLGDGVARAATPIGGSYASWSCIGTLTRTGNLTIIATAKVVDLGKQITGQATRAIVSRDVTGPTLTVTAPTEVTGSDPTCPATISGTAADTQSGLKSVEYNLDGGAYQTVATPASWSINLNLTLGAHTVRVRATDNSLNKTEQSKTITFKDKIAPALTILSPATWPFVMLGDEQGATLVLTGTAVDTQSGVDRVEWSLTEQGPYQAATPRMPGDWSEWSCIVQFPAPGDYGLRVRCVDKATPGNEIVSVRDIEVNLPLTQSDPETVVSPQSYLSDLLGFTVLRVKRSATETLVDRPLLANKLYQPFADLAAAAADSAAVRRVSQVRAAAEVLRRYLKAQRTAPAGYWKLDETSGTTASDASTPPPGRPGTVSSGAWVTGRSGKALSLTGTGSLTVPSSLQVGAGGSDFAVALWVKLNEVVEGGFSSGNWRTLVGAQNNRTPFIHIGDNNHLHVRIATSALDDEGGDGQVQIPAGAWTHVAYVKAGSRVALYVNGALDAQVDLVGTVVPNNGSIVFGKITGTNWGNGVNGCLDDIRIYDRSLDAGEIYDLFKDVVDENSGTAGGPAEAAYRFAAYQAILARLGTSYDEIRLARAAEDEVRRALAARLGITLADPPPDGQPRNDYLDQLFFAPDLVTEAGLQTLFGLAPTTTDPLAATDPVQPSLLTWQLARLHASWKTQDAQPQERGGLPVIDPDIVSRADLQNPAAGNAAYDLWQQRRSWEDGRLSAIRDKRKGATTPQAGFAAIVADTLPGMDLAALDQARKAGTDISAQLAQQQLPLADFLYLVRIKNLAAAGTVLDAEWDDVYAILVQVEKQRLYATWRSEEGDHEAVLGPTFFVRPDPAARPGLRRWLATPTARRQWEATLKARYEQEAGLAQGLAQAASAAEAEALPGLRDSLIAAIARGRLPVDQAADELTQLLYIDCRDQGGAITTRVDQANETLQGMLFGIRTGRNQHGYRLGANPTASWCFAEQVGGEVYGNTDFDAEWEWMGTYATWRPAMLIMGYPENLLLPSLRRTGQPADPARDPTPEFVTLIAELRNNPKPRLDEVATMLQDFVTAALPHLVLSDDVTAQDLAIRSGRKASELAGRQTKVAHMVAANTVAGRPPEALAYLREIFYFIPVHLGLAYQRAGDLQRALEWHQEVYAYNLPAAQRKIYEPLQLESGQDAYHRDVRWLLDELNPHHVAATRHAAYSRFTIMSTVRCLLDFADAEFTADSSESRPRARALYMTALDLLAADEMQPNPPGAALSPFPTNPMIDVLAGKAWLNLAKLRGGRNIAGMQRAAEPTSAARAPRPTPYHYTALLERAKQLVSLAQQVESAYLAALEKRDIEVEKRGKADQDLDLAARTVGLQAQRLTAASRSVELADLQGQRAGLQVTTYDGWLDVNGIFSVYENKLLDYYEEARNYRNYLAMANAALTTAQTVSSALSGVQNPVGALAGMALVAGAAAGQMVTTMAVNNIEMGIQQTNQRFSFEQQKKQWTLQRELAAKDEEIALKQKDQALDQQKVATTEWEIAGAQQQHAQDYTNFLQTKFTNAELYEWMGQVLGGVYRYFLQQATAVAQMAQGQLAFERQEPVSSFIQADYWTPPGEAAGAAAAGTGSTGGQTATADRRGLTGSARLLQDVYQLDEYAFETKKRKLELAQTFSLAQLAPHAFQTFCQSGKLPFTTPMELFDRAFPGHYLRLIKRVRMSVVALVPPTQGIRATLAASGISRVVVSGAPFQTVTIARDPETIAFTSPSNATGLLDLDPQPELLLPFEAMGVDTSWEFQMPRPANPFDFRTIADVLFTIEYTALNSFDYRTQVIRKLDPERAAEYPVSLVNRFPDAWYALANTVPAAGAPLVACFNTTRAEYPPNLDDLQIKDVLLYFAQRPGTVAEIDVQHLHFTPESSTTALGGSATTIDGGVASTRRPDGTNGTNGANWICMRGKVPYGAWELALPAILQSRFANGEIDDILLVITYVGQTPAWPD